MTLMEYLHDYASAQTKEKGLAAIRKEMENISSDMVRELTARHLEDIMNGQRDFRF